MLTTLLFIFSFIFFGVIIFQLLRILSKDLDFLGKMMSFIRKLLKSE
jgi:hypothetical protein